MARVVLVVVRVILRELSLLEERDGGMRRRKGDGVHV
jgi:hypothetical protein